MAAALLHCVAALPRLNSNHHRQACITSVSTLEASVYHTSVASARGFKKVRSSTSRCSCSTRDESFTGDGNVELFDNKAGELEDFIANAKDTLVVLDISTKTCGPCKVIYPKLVKMSTEYPDAVFLKINGDHDTQTRALMRKWKIRAVPSFRFFRNGELVHSHSGAKEDELRAHFLVHYMKVPKISVK